MNQMMNAAIAMSETPTKVRVVKPCWIRGKPEPLGSTHELPAVEAAIAVASGRCVLVPWDELTK